MFRQQSVLAGTGFRNFPASEFLFLFTLNLTFNEQKQILDTIII